MKDRRAGSRIATAGAWRSSRATSDEAREWRRRVTGRFEEYDNLLRRLEGRIDRLIADVDFRLAGP